MAIKITPQELVRLDELIRFYYGNDINIYVMHGLMVSYLCSANNDKFDDLMFDYQNREPILEFDYNGDISSEFTQLFLGKLFNQTVDLVNKGKLIYPLISTDAFNGKVNLKALSIDSKRNLLDWYMGFYYGYATVWVHEIIHDYINREIVNDGDELASSIEANGFLSALNMYYIVVDRLVKELKPNYSNDMFNYSIEKIQSALKEMPKGIFAVAKSLLDAMNKYETALSEILGFTYNAKNYNKTIGSHSTAISNFITGANDDTIH